MLPQVLEMMVVNCDYLPVMSSFASFVAETRGTKGLEKTAILLRQLHLHQLSLLMTLLFKRKKCNSCTKKKKHSRGDQFEIVMNGVMKELVSAQE